MLLIVQAEAADCPDVLSGQWCKELLYILTSFSIRLESSRSSEAYGYTISDLMLSPWTTLNDLGLSHSCQVACSTSGRYECVAVICLAIFG